MSKKTKTTALATPPPPQSTALTAPELLKDIVDQKVSRNELLDIFMEQMQSEFQDARRDAESEYHQTADALSKVKLTAGEVRDMFTDKNARVGVVPTYGKPGEFSLTLTFTRSGVKESELPKRYLEAFEANRLAQAKYTQADDKYHDMLNSKGKARAALLKKLLGSTAAGQQVLGILDGLHDQVKQSIEDGAKR